MLDENQEKKEHKEFQEEQVSKIEDEVEEKDLSNQSKNENQKENKALHSDSANDETPSEIPKEASLDNVSSSCDHQLHQYGDDGSDIEDITQVNVRRAQQLLQQAEWSEVYKHDEYRVLEPSIPSSDADPASDVVSRMVAEHQRNGGGNGVGGEVSDIPAWLPSVARSLIQGILAHDNMSRGSNSEALPPSPAIHPSRVEENENNPAIRQGYEGYQYNTDTDCWPDNDDAGSADERTEVLFALIQDLLDEDENICRTITHHVTDIWTITDSDEAKEEEEIQRLRTLLLSMSAMQYRTNTAEPGTKGKKSHENESPLQAIFSAPLFGSDMYPNMVSSRKKSNNRKIRKRKGEKNKDNNNNKPKAKVNLKNLKAREQGWQN
eukprot:gb/GECH01002523.1/.p1 GENE.gb/GECH01002523.1/~~gb/GECH01002523.1/.p1  ORF type:complete len:379 (+),score=85.34 gb/GECH01002523.1/:1-1137(+)